MYMYARFLPAGCARSVCLARLFCLFVEIPSWFLDMKYQSRSIVGHFVLMLASFTGSFPVHKSL